MAAHSVKQPEPLLSRARVITVIAALAALLIKLNLGDLAGELVQYEDPIAGIVLIVAPYVTARLARKHVTPVASPRDSDGGVLAAVGSPVHVSSILDAALAEAEEIFPTA